VVIAGGAGMKIQSAGELWARAALLSGCDATLKGDFPITVMTGFSVAEVVVDPEEVLYTGVDEPDALLAIDPDGVRRCAQAIAAMTPAGAVYCDPSLVDSLPETRARIVEAPFLSEARSVDRFAAAPLALGYLAAVTGALSIEALCAAADSSLRPELAAKARAAVERGAALTRRA
jgi:Pyruvate/2-oxoacid:ferredoxin oxidoreductase gamma subunit